MKYTNDEQVVRLWDTEHIRHTMNRMCYYITNEDFRGCLNDLWVRKNRRTASLGYNNGFYVGMDEIVRHWVLEQEQTRYERLSKYGGAAVSSENLGLGCARMATLTTPLIKLHGDGKTAQYQGYMPGFQSWGNSDGTMETYLTLDMCFADLIKEEGQWKIWHLILMHDHTMEAGKPYGKIPTFGWEDPMEASFGTPTVARTLHDPSYGWELLYDDMPRELDTYCEKYSYGPDGDFGKQYFERDKR